MPLPIAHAVVGATTHYLSTQDNAVFKQWKTALAVTLLANLPDLDVLIGLVFWGNGNAIHRGPTHSLIFALAMGYFFSRACRVFPAMPAMGFLNSSLVIFSHVLADYFFTSYPVSLFWPFHHIFSIGYTGWGDVFSSVVFGNIRDAGIILGCCAVLLSNIWLKKAYQLISNRVWVRTNF